MEILGHNTGPFVCRGGFTSDFDVPAYMPIQPLVNDAENERPTMDTRPGIRHKYTPLRIDSVALLRHPPYFPSTLFLAAP